MLVDDHTNGNWLGRSIWAKIEKTDNVKIFDGVAQIGDGVLKLAETTEKLANKDFELLSLISTRWDCLKNENPCNPNNYLAQKEKFNDEFSQQQLKVAFDKVLKHKAIGEQEGMCTIMSFVESLSHAISLYIVCPKMSTESGNFRRAISQDYYNIWTEINAKSKSVNTIPTQTQSYLL
jgi:hypothetical protein